MSLPITIEGQKYFVQWPALGDFRTFRDFLARKLRKEMGEAIPPGLPDDELERRTALIQKKCDEINALKSMGGLTDTPDGAAILFHAWLRHENPSATLDWATGFLGRCEQSKPAALEGLRELKEAMLSLIDSKKNEFAALVEQVEQAAAQST